MKHHRFSKRSMDKMERVHPDLVRVAVLALEYSRYDFGITCGARTMEEQKKRLEEGSTSTLNSRHVIENNECQYSCAIDVVAWVSGNITWSWPCYEKIAKAFFKAAIELGVQIEWGGFWSSPKDGVHFQLARGEYP